ncbi:MAG TPA: carbohydrate-binding protein [Arsenophonus sp.]
MLVNAARKGLGCLLINEDIDMSKYYLWHVPKEILVDSENKSVLSFIAPNVTKAKDFNIAVTITDELDDSDSNIHVLRVKTGKEPNYPLWRPGAVYWGGDRVSWQDQNWEAQWWSQNNELGELEDGNHADPSSWKEIE